MLLVLSGLFSMFGKSLEQLEAEELCNKYIKSKFFSAHIEKFLIIFSLSYCITLILAGFWYFGKISALMCIASGAITGILLLLVFTCKIQRLRLLIKFKNENPEKARLIEG